MAAAVDTNVLVRVLTRDDERQVEAAERFLASGAWVSHLVLAETTWVLQSRYGFGHEQIATAVEHLLSRDDVTVQDRDAVVAALHQYRAKPTVKFSDHLAVEIARNAGHYSLEP